MRPTDEQLKDPAWWDENDPSGGEATHWVGPAENPWEKHCRQEKFVWWDGHWELLSDSEDAWFSDGGWILKYDCSMPRPTQPQWTWPEDGFPPVDTVCEGRRAGESYGEGCIKYRLDKLIVWQFSKSGDELAMRPGAMEFRPIRTQAEIEREDVVSAAMEERPVGMSTHEHQMLSRFCGRLYDAGMLRKPMSHSEAMKKLGAVYSSQREIISDALRVLGFKETTK